LLAEGITISISGASRDGTTRASGAVVAVVVRVLGKDRVGGDGGWSE
jgi:L-asparaginase II